MGADGAIRLAVPASPEYLRMTRLMAAGVAGRLGFSLEEIEDLRIAIDEVCFALVGDRGRPGTVVVTYRVSGDGLVVEGEGRFEEGLGVQPRLSPLSSRILSVVVDECSLEAGPTGPTFRLVKHRGR